ncbi:MAG: hypothetical protein ACD_62C00065G0008, partial [uncultured bacterium]
MLNFWLFLCAGCPEFMSGNDSSETTLIDSCITDTFSQLYGPAALVTEEWRLVPPLQRFLVIPGKSGPRWIVPERARLGWPVLQQWRPYDVYSLCKWVLLAVAYRCGQLRRIPGVRRIGIAGNNVQPALGISVERERFVPVVYIGTPGKSRKAVVTLVGLHDAKPFGVAKLPLSGGAATNILREARMLEQLASFKAGVAPKLLSADATTGRAVQEVVAGRITGRRLTGRHIDWLCQVQTGGTITLMEHSRALATRVRKLALDQRQSDYIMLLLQEIVDATPLPAVWVHGDFAPWNLKETVHGLRAIDWEEAQKGGLPLVDLVYFFAIQGYLFGQRQDVMDGFFCQPLVQRYMAAFNLTHQQANRLVLLALTDFWLKRAQQGEQQHAAFLFAVI